MALNINFEDFSNGVVDYTNPTSPEWSGSGVFDKLMHAINGNILVQYENGRIKGPEYAQVYLGSMQAAISESMKFMLTKDQIAKDLEVKDKDLELKGQQILSMKNDDTIKTAQSTKDLEVKTAQKNKLVDDLLTAEKQRDLYQRQILGFNDNKLQKLFESQVSSWGLMFSSGMLTEKPAFITGTQVTDLYNKLIKDN